MRHLIFRTPNGSVSAAPLYTDVSEDTARADITAVGGVIIADEDHESPEVWAVVDQLRRRPIPINVVASWG
ncbi:MAG: hypothetical protein ACREEB_01380 [Caulobacteraceae bacterium]